MGGGGFGGRLVLHSTCMTYEACTERVGATGLLCLARLLFVKSTSLIPGYRFFVLTSATLGQKKSLIRTPHHPLYILGTVVILPCSTACDILSTALGTHRQLSMDTFRVPPTTRYKSGQSVIMGIGLGWYLWWSPHHPPPTPTPCRGGWNIYRGGPTWVCIELHLPFSSSKISILVYIG